MVIGYLDNTAPCSQETWDCGKPPLKATRYLSTNKRVCDPLPISGPKTLQQDPQLQAPNCWQGIGMGKNKWGLGLQN